jgi:NTP pyrophosphatase (non-canonical NTP hydrolase)
MSKIYVASSWRNENQPAVVQVLREAGHEVYDFRNPREGDNGFHWSEVDKNWQKWSPEQYRDSLEHPIAKGGFKSDMVAMKWADVFVGVMPFGRSASLEMGWAAGQGKTTALLLADGEPELMVKMLDYICCTVPELLYAVSNLKTEPVIEPAITSFAKTMQFKLDKNKFKLCENMNPTREGRTWGQCSQQWLLKRLREESLELEEALVAGNVDDIQNEAGDVGNFAMMIHDNASK